MSERAITPLPEYVVGFNFFGPRFERVVLIRKNKPAWQGGKLNGIGGLIEPGEAAAVAMDREYCEETGDDFRPTWIKFCTLRFPAAVVHFFKSFSPQTTAHDTTAEPIVLALLGSMETETETLANLRWLLPMARWTNDNIDATQEYL